MPCSIVTKQITPSADHVFTRSIKTLAATVLKKIHEVGTAATGWLITRHWLVSTRGRKSDYVV
jgi:hypothetical protein